MPLINHVSDTAFLVAQYRADESSRRRPLFRDPLAARLAGEKGRVIGESFTTARMTAWSVVVRTVVIDRLILEAIAHGVRLIVNLGAGLDTRPYRLDLPNDVHWIEADFAPVIEYKSGVLSNETPHCELERVSVDLSNAMARRAFLAAVDARGERFLVLTEGVILYLSEEDVGALADDLRALSNVDGWIVDYFAPEVHEYRARAGVTQQMQNAPFRFAPDDWYGFFSGHGWCPRTSRFLPMEGLARGRPMPIPWKARIVMFLMRPFIPAERKKRFLEMLGYVLLEKC